MCVNTKALCGTEGDGLSCPANSFCADAGFNNDHLNFDSFGQAFLTALVSISGEGWSAIMYEGWDTLDKYTTIYFFSMMLLGSMFVFQLLVVVLRTTFSFTKEHEKDRQKGILTLISINMAAGRCVICVSLFSVSSYSDFRASVKNALREMPGAQVSY